MAQGTVQHEGQRLLPLDRLSYPPAKEHFQPFAGGCLMPHNIRNPDDKGNYIEAVTVLDVTPDGERVFVKFYRTGNTGWIETDRLTDR